MGSLKIEHVAALAVVALIAYKVGMSKGGAAVASAPGTNVPAQAAWWTYASSWQM